MERHVTERTGRLTGLRVAPARVTVTGLTGPARASATTLVKPPSAGRTPRRHWSARRVPVVGAALAAALGCGAVTVDLLRVHLAGHPAAAWRTGLLHALERRGPADLPPALGAVLAVVGLWLCVLALTPGRRGLLGAATPGLNAAVDRTAVASVIRDAVADVPGCARVRVRVGRRRARVRAELAFGARETAAEAVAAAVRRALDDCALRRAPRPTITLRPAPPWQPPESVTGPPHLPPARSGTGEPPTRPAGPSRPAGEGTALARPRSVEDPCEETRPTAAGPADPPASPDPSEPAGHPRSAGSEA